MELPDEMTIGECYGPAMKMTDKEEAHEYYEALVRRSMRKGKTRQEAESIQKSNLGYYAGYYSHETRLRVEKLFMCAHPIFGDATGGAPTAEEAFEAGRKMGASI